MNSIRNIKNSPLPPSTTPQVLKESLDKSAVLETPAEKVKNALSNALAITLEATKNLSSGEMPTLETGRNTFTEVMNPIRDIQQDGTILGTDESNSIDSLAQQLDSIFDEFQKIMDTQTKQVEKDLQKSVYYKQEILKVTNEQSIAIVTDGQLSAKYITLSQTLKDLEAKSSIQTKKNSADQQFLLKFYKDVMVALNDKLYDAFGS